MNDTTSAARYKAPRYLRLARHPQADAPGRLLIFEGKRRVHIDDYLLSEIDTDFGLAAFRLEKTRSTRTGWKPETYHVLIITCDRSECDCRGHEAHGHCKHVESLRCLLEGRRLISARYQRQRDEETLELIQAERFSGPDLD